MPKLRLPFFCHVQVLTGFTWFCPFRLFYTSFPQRLHHSLCFSCVCIFVSLTAKVNLLHFLFVSLNGFFLTSLIRKSSFSMYRHCDKFLAQICSERTKISPVGNKRNRTHKRVYVYTGLISHIEKVHLTNIVLFFCLLYVCVFFFHPFFAVLVNLCDLFVYPIFFVFFIVYFFYVLFSL